MARGSYRAAAARNHPAVVIPETIHARIVIAAEEAGITPGRLVEEMLRDGLKRHGQGMEDAAFYAACRDAERKRDPSIHRHEFNQGRSKRVTDPR